jgi:hypothetical protein
LANIQSGISKKENKRPSCCIHLYSK